MATSLGVNTVSVNPSNIFAGEIDQFEIPVTIATTQVLTRGTCLAKKTADSKYYKWDTTKSDGTQTLAGILSTAVDTTGGDDVGSMIVCGAFDKNALTAAQTIVEGIYGLIIIKGVN